MTTVDPDPLSTAAADAPPADSVRPEFGTRYLTEGADIWSFNAWDQVPPPDDQDDVVAAALAKQHGAPVSEEDKAQYNRKPSGYWDEFYKSNEENFFRNRKWLHREFPDLLKASSSDAGKVTVAEIGCGAGNAAFPLLSENQNPDLSILAFDYSGHAVKLVQRNPLYENPPVGRIRAAKWDLTSASLPPEVEEASVDLVLLVFVLSALHPDEWAQAVSNVRKMLKPGGKVFVRDYGRYDLTQLRFKSNRLLSDNFYIRGDKTRVYFFELDELAILFTGRAATSEEKTERTTVEEADVDPGSTASPPPSGGTDTPTHSAPSGTSATSTKLAPAPAPRLHPNLTAEGGFERPASPPFSLEALHVDRRLLVNRKRQLKMYRVWMQGVFVRL